MPKTFFFSSGSGKKKDMPEPMNFRQIPGGGVTVVDKRSHTKTLKKIPVSSQGVRNPVFDYADDYDVPFVQNDFQQAHEEKLAASIKKDGVIHPQVLIKREKDGADWNHLLESGKIKVQNFNDARDLRDD
jgi:hypothetical protein